MMFGVTLPFETLSRQLLSSIGFQTLLLTEKGVEKKDFKALSIKRTGA